ncbi:MAG TPA: hypothetical protein OIM43_12785 [Prevotellaceae bacterium]|uniref:hypothetical protein n=1 Tax=uncultured Prevotella sp. TaxID=159272 RepID=UPI002675B723|nr:hypothetical protein [uncultured Prevotella sp.]HJH77853.1 hypothetical protein [Prevotellaceae bacterium]
MDSTVVKILYTNAFNDIESARNCQNSISQKEMELQMININSKYSSFDNSYLNNMKKQSLEMEIMNLKDKRNNYINSSIGYALTIAVDEIQENNGISVAAIVIGTISSFISNIKDSFNISILNSSSLSLISSELLFSGLDMFQLKNAIERLKSVCKVI